MAPEEAASADLGESEALAESEVRTTTRAMVELTQALASSLDMSDILYTVVRRIASFVNVARVSVVLAPEGDQGQVAFVVAASDNQEISNLRIELPRYPEIVEVLRSRELLTIDDAATHPMLEGVREGLPKEGLGPVTLLPITWREETMGVLFLRKARDRGLLSTLETEFCQAAANATAIALRNARVMQTLRDQTQQVNFARFEAERRMRKLSRYADLVASAADGLVAFDHEGRLLFANPRAYAIAGVAEDAMPASLLELVHVGDQRRLLGAWSAVRRGLTTRAVDVRMGERIVACSFSPEQQTRGAVLIIRDVTVERHTARELVRVNDFLESLIRASADAIIAADVTGKILVFNPGAERITGWRADEMLGKRAVSSLYPGDGAREVMRLMRAATTGHFEASRWDVQDREGRIVPVRLSAAMISDADGRPFGTVGIFTDLREKMRIELRLSEAQEKLALTEKQSLLAELAGTAAHELNQPLTSVIAACDLLARRVAGAGPIEAEPVRRTAETIAKEAGRMAEIVKQIGALTRYETREYVGSQRILELGPSSGEPDATP